MKFRSPVRAHLFRQAADEHPADRQTEKPPSSRVRSDRSLDKILESIEQRIEVPADIEDRVVLHLLERESGASVDNQSTTDMLSAIERRIQVPKEVEDRVVAAVLRGEMASPGSWWRWRSSVKRKLGLGIAVVVLIGSVALLLFLVASKI